MVICRERCGICAPGFSRTAPLRAPHDYGLAIVLLGVADAIVPPDQVAAAARRHLLVSRSVATRRDRQGQGGRGVRARENARGRAGRAGAHVYGLRERARRRAARPAAAPDTGAARRRPRAVAVAIPPPRCQVYLLHGTDDNVVPGDRVHVAGAGLPRSWRPVELLETPLITHAEVDRSSTATPSGG